MWRGAPALAVALLNLRKKKKYLDITCVSFYHQGDAGFFFYKRAVNLTAALTESWRRLRGRSYDLPIRD